MYEAIIFIAGFSAGVMLMIAMMLIAADDSEPDKARSSHDRQPPSPKPSGPQETKRRWSWDPSRFR
jgi:hypothetical protein